MADIRRPLQGTGSTGSSSQTQSEGAGGGAKSPRVSIPKSLQRLLFDGIWDRGDDDTRADTESTEPTIVVEDALVRKAEHTARIRRPVPTATIEDASATRPVTAPVDVLRQSRDDRNREQYLEWCAGRIEEAVATETRDRAVVVVSLTDAAQRFVAAIRAQARSERVQLWIGVLQDQAAADAAADFDAIAALRIVARVEPADYGLVVVTKPLALTVEGATYLLGKLEYHLAVGGQLRVFNQTRRVAVRWITWDHPFVRDGLPLLPPTLRVRIVRALAARRFVDAVRALTGFLADIQTVRDGYVSIIRWPVVQKEVRDGV